MFCLWNSESLGFGIRNTAQGIRNPANYWNPEFKFHWQGIRSQETFTWGDKWLSNRQTDRQLCKPETKSRVRVTVENSPNPSSVYIRQCKHRKKVFYCFYKITFPRKTQNSLLWHWLKEKFLPVAKSCTRSLARVISSCFVKRCYSKYGFLSLYQ